MKATCSKVADTRWLSWGRVSKWLLKKYILMSDFLELKQPACAPPCEWWINFSVVKVVIIEIVKPSLTPCHADVSKDTFLTVKYDLSINNSLVLL